jgi:hypothetical protein
MNCESQALLEDFEHLPVLRSQPTHGVTENTVPFPAVPPAEAVP